MKKTNRTRFNTKSYSNEYLAQVIEWMVDADFRQTNGIGSFAAKEISAYGLSVLYERRQAAKTKAARA